MIWIDINWQIGRAPRIKPLLLMIFQTTGKYSEDSIICHWFQIVLLFTKQCGLRPMFYDKHIFLPEEKRVCLLMKTDCSICDVLYLHNDDTRFTRLINEHMLIRYNAYCLLFKCI